MGYKKLITMDVTEILRRKQQGQNISAISKALGYDRKTIRKYINSLTVSSDNQPVVPDTDTIRLSIQQSPGRPKEKQDILKPYKQEIEDLISEPKNRLKPKSAFEVICLRHDLSAKVSYSSFKRFIRKNHLHKSQKNITCRFDYEPGSQVQIDYAKCGLIKDPLSGKGRTVYAFIGSLSFSRHKYVEYVFKQDQASFIESHIKMFNFFGGVPLTIKPDNLKTGVIKPDLYDPRINKAYAEMAEHYEVFIDPCRVASPKDKGIVERDVQTVREEFRKMIAVNNNLTLPESNKDIKHWLINTYGMKKHGTTNEQPYLHFTKTEQPSLHQLPIEPFEISEWFSPKVNVDHYIQIKTKASGEVKCYSVQTEHIGKVVQVRATHRLIQIYYNEEMIKQHTVALGYRRTDISDFPDNMRHSLDTGRPFYLRKEAAKISLELEKLISKTLYPNVYLNDRRARGIIEYARKYPVEIVESASRYVMEHYSYISPKDFKSVMEKHQKTIEPEPVLPLSEETGSFVRSADYFTHQQ
jgi:transposase